MLALIAGAAIKAITCYLVTGYMKSHFGSVDIKGAPHWYGREDRDEICVSDVKRGDVTQLDDAKKIVKVKLEKKLSNIVNYAIHSNKKFANLKPDEEEFINSLINDKKLKWFVGQNGYYKNIKVDDDTNMIFIRMCVKKDKFIDYEKNRIKTLQKELSIYKANKNFNELDDKSTPKANDQEDKDFKELDNF